MDYSIGHSKSRAGLQSLWWVPKRYCAEQKEKKRTKLLVTILSVEEKLNWSFLYIFNYNQDISQIHCLFNFKNKCFWVCMSHYGLHTPAPADGLR